jgi:DNA-binding NarL/FixJ family response regulator
MIERQPASSLPLITDREVQVLQQSSLGLRTREIATALGISTRTVQAHVRHILVKLGARSRTQAVAHAIRSGWF